MENWRDFFSRGDLLGSSIAVGIVLAFFLYLQHQTVSADLQLEVTTDRAGTLQVYWLGSEASYSEQRSCSLPMAVDRLNRLSVPLSGVNRITKLRIDPLENVGHLTITKALLQAPWIKDQDLLATIQPDNLVDIQRLKLTRSGPAIKLTALAEDPYFVIAFIEDLAISYRENVLLGGGLMVVLLICLVINRRLLKGAGQAGILQISLPATDGQDPQALPLELLAGAGLAVPKITRKLGQGRLVYTSSFSRLSPEELLPLIAKIRRELPQALIHFQYNRAGEA